MIRLMRAATTAARYMLDFYGEIDWGRPPTERGLEATGTACCPRRDQVRPYAPGT
jgi:hypothetical protein